jgi:hypothetical protein
LWVHEADADQRHAEIRGLLAVIAGEDAQPAGIERERLVQGEFGREVRDALAAELGEFVRPPRVARRASRIESRNGCVVQAQEFGIARGGVELRLRNQPQHAYRVVRRDAPQVVIQTAEHTAAFAVPTPPEIGCQFGQALQWVG